VWGGQFTANTGETITLYDSSYYAQDAHNAQFLQNMANFMADVFPHGSEFSRLTVGFAPPFELGSLCGSPYAIGCYNPATQFMFVPGNDLPDGTNLETVLAHEYGHHIANNRDNAPWNALDWGPKYWASYMNICSRVQAGTAFPGDEGQHYLDNPGEGWAETYRLLVYDSRTWTNGWWKPAPWDSGQAFYPDSGALQAALHDATNPWTESYGTTTLSGRFTRKVTTRRFTIDTPDDGTMSVGLFRPLGGVLTLIDAESGAIIGRTQASFSYTICGSRTLTLLMSGRPGQRFLVRVSTP
jgi:hypothetical protein